MFKFLVICLLLGIYIKLSQVLRTLRRAVKTITASRVEFYAVVDGQTRKVFSMNLKVTQKLPLSIQIKDSRGNPAPVDGIPQWSLTDPAKGSFESISEDGMSAVFLPAGPMGDVEAQVSVDADLGEGVKPILGVLPISILPGEAAVVEISAGEPQDI